MTSKTNCHQRAISNFNFSKRNRSQLIAHLKEGKLLINVARLGQMYAFAKLTLGDQQYISDSSDIGGLYPKWNQFFSFNLDLEHVLHLQILDQSLLFGETEIGKCQVNLEDIIHNNQMSCLNILNTNGQPAGEVYLSFEFTQETVVHSSNSSWDFKLQIEASPLNKARGHSKHSTVVTARTPDIKITHCSTEPDEIFDLGTLRIDLTKESERIRNQEKMICVIFDKQKEERAALCKEKIQEKIQKEKLQKKEENMLENRKEIDAEKRALELERKELERIKEHLNAEYLKLKLEKLKARANRSLQTRINIQINKNSSRILRQFDSLKKLTDN